MTTPRDDIAGLSERLRDYRVWSATHGRYNAVELTLEAATALDALQARVKELEDHNRRLGQGGAERYWEERYRDEAAHALRAQQERDEAYERAVQAIRGASSVDGVALQGWQPIESDEVNNADEN